MTLDVFRHQDEREESEIRQQAKAAVTKTVWQEKSPKIAHVVWEQFLIKFKYFRTYEKRDLFKV